jgi:ribosomal protein S18 acetylase RimI-like enzyme
MNFALRALEEGDLDRVLKFWTGMEGIGLNESDTPPRLAAFLRRNPGLSRLAIEADRIVGAVLCGHDGRRGTLHHLAVAPESRGQGIGRALVEACLRALADEGILKCNVFLFADNDLGRSFWEQAGWKQRLDLHVLQHGCP